MYMLIEGKVIDVNGKRVLIKDHEVIPCVNQSGVKLEPDMDVRVAGIIGKKYYKILYVEIL